MTLPSLEAQPPNVGLPSGTLHELIDEIIDTCCEEGMPCCGVLCSQLRERLKCFAANEGSNSDGASAVYQRWFDELDGPEVSATALIRMQRELGGVSRPLLPR